MAKILLHIKIQTKNMATKTTFVDERTVEVEISTGNLIEIQSYFYTETKFLAGSNNLIPRIQTSPHKNAPLR